MRLSVFYGKKTKEVEIDPDGTVSDMKLKIQARYGVLREDQALLLENSVLEDDKKVQHYGLNEFSCIHVLVKFWINVHGPNPKRVFKIKANDEMTVGDVKEILEEMGVDMTDKKLVSEKPPKCVDLYDEDNLQVSSFSASLPSTS